MVANYHGFIVPKMLHFDIVMADADTSSLPAMARMPGKLCMAPFPLGSIAVYILASLT